MSDAPDTRALLNAVIPFARQMLAKHGEFFPFGATMDVDGQIGLSASMPDSEDEQEVLAMLIALHRQQARAGVIRGSAVCYNARVTLPRHAEKQDAICVELEHRLERCPVVPAVSQATSEGASVRRAVRNAARPAGVRDQAGWLTGRCP